MTALPPPAAGLVPTPPEATTAARALRCFRDPGATLAEREAAACELVQTYGPWMLDHRRKWPALSPDDIEDAMADTLHRFFALAPADHASPEAWLRLAFVNRLRDCHRLGARHGGQSLPLVDDAGDDVGVSVASPPQSDPALRAAVRELLRAIVDVVHRDRPRDLPLLEAYAAGESITEMAQRLGVAEGVLRQRMLALRRYLRRMLGLGAQERLT